MKEEPAEEKAYDPATLEPKWQSYWKLKEIFKTTNETTKPKYYILDMFPYPSGEGLHVGHPLGYVATDILARVKRMQGMNVLHPMGWDAFGHPAERYAIKTGTHPAKRTEECIQRFKGQLQKLGLSYDWSREVNTTDPKYYRWTQWIFKKLYERNLASISEEPVNWSDHYKIVLANEEVQDGKYEGHPVRRIRMRQWVLKITHYAERLLQDLELVDWPVSTKEMQKNWIGKSEGAVVRFPLYVEDDPNLPSVISAVKSNLPYRSPLKDLEVFTTRPDTLFGATFMVVAPEHPILKTRLPEKRRQAVNAYCEKAALKSDLARTDLNQDKDGVESGLVAINPVNGDVLPVFVADYVLMNYGTGAIMAVPAHDQRDFEFAKKYQLRIRRVVAPSPSLVGTDSLEAADTENGVAVNSGFLDGLKTEAAQDKMCQWLESHQRGKKTVNYKLRDWLFSRQRYWGEPFPVIHWEDGTISLVDNKELPVELPAVEKYEPTESGESPLALIQDWVNVVDPKTGKKGRRETNTMPQWAGSCWYYLRYLDPQNQFKPFNEEAEKYWMPVDLYLGGAEHAVLHLLYARFWHKVLFDAGIVHTKEPFKKLFHQGMILGTDGEKMSKSRGNVINPDEILEKYGADAFRLYLMFMGPLEKAKPWNTQGLEGTHRFLTRVFRWITTTSLTNATEDTWTTEQKTNLHRLIDQVTKDADALSMNTAIAKMMEFLNAAIKWPDLPRALAKTFVQLLAPFAPHVGEELWEFLGGENSVTYQAWPKANPQFVAKTEVEMGVQVNGKLRASILLSATATEEEAVAKALADASVQKYVTSKEQLKKIIYKAGRILNLIV